MAFRDNEPWGPYSHDPRDDTPPSDPAERFEQRIVSKMRSVDRGRTWVIDKLRKSHPAEHAAWVASKRKG